MIDEKVFGKLIWRDDMPHFEGMTEEICVFMNIILLAILRDSLRKYAIETLYIGEEGYLALLSDENRLI